jgi:hypothetical protein
VAQWTLDPARFCNSAIENIEKVRRIYAFEIFRRVVERTPVDTGAARQNWNVTLNQEDTSYDLDKKKGGRVMSDGQKAIESAKGDQTIFIANGIPYIAKLEYGGYPKNQKHGGKTKEYTRKDGTKVGGLPKTVNGFSLQAPKGMVGLTMAQAKQIFQAAVNAVKGGGA